MLDREIVKDVMVEFSIAFGWPRHIDRMADASKKQEVIKKLVDIYQKQLSRHYHNGNFAKGCAIAWDSAVRFSAVSSFYKGYEAPEAEVELPEGYIC